MHAVMLHDFFQGMEDLGLCVLFLFDAEPFGLSALNEDVKDFARLLHKGQCKGPATRATESDQICSDRLVLQQQFGLLRRQEAMEPSVVVLC